MIYLVGIILSFFIFNLWYYLEGAENYLININHDVQVLAVASLIWPIAWFVLIGIILVMVISSL